MTQASKRVVVIASGATEHAALPHLLRHLEAEGIALAPPVRYPPGHRDVRGDIVSKLVRAAWFTEFPRPDKFVVLKDADGKPPDEVEDRLRGEILATGVSLTVPVPILVAAAKWHLEAWFFADPPALRAYLGGRDLGAIDPSDPDAVPRPKLHLRSLLSEPYTAAVAGEIAAAMSPTQLRRSKSFSTFERAMRNGG